MIFQVWKWVVGLPPEEKRGNDFDEEEYHRDRQSLLRWSIGSIVVVIAVLWMMLAFLNVG